MARAAALRRVSARLTPAAAKMRCHGERAARVDGGLELPLKVVQARLGHASIQMTAETYGHLFPRGDDGSVGGTGESVFSGLMAVTGRRLASRGEREGRNRPPTRLPNPRNSRAQQESAFALNRPQRRRPFTIRGLAAS